MTSGEKMAALLGLLRKEMNGAVVGSMGERGLDYPLSYGVSVPVVRRIARTYAPDHLLARLLWQQEVRELRLAALTIADPLQVTVEELDFWGRGVLNTEVVEHLASTLLCHTSIVGEVLDRWMTWEDDLLRYAALLTGARALRGGAWSGPWHEILPKMVAALHSDRVFVWEGAVQMLACLAERFEEGGAAALEIERRVAQEGLPCADYLDEELSWRLPSEKK